VLANFTVCEGLTAPRAITAKRTSKPFISTPPTCAQSNLLRRLFLLPLGVITAPTFVWLLLRAGGQNRRRGGKTDRSRDHRHNDCNRDYQQLSSLGLNRVNHVALAGNHGCASLAVRTSILLIERVERKARLKRKSLLLECTIRFLGARNPASLRGVN
jgi:hypothetical protein